MTDGHSASPARLTHYAAEPIHRLRPEARGFGKPHGFWVSVDADGQGWADWCRSEESGLERLTHRHDVTLTADARILRLTTPSDLDDFTARHGTDLTPGMPSIDWAGVAVDWQGIIIAPYQWSRRLELLWYYGWDCGSGCIWDLTAVESVRPLAPTAISATTAWEARR